VFAVVFWAKTIKDEFRPPAADEAAGPPVLPATARPAEEGDAGTHGDGQEDPGDEELAAYNAYLARLHEQAKGHGRWHGLR
jgi:hypothetical protein